MMRVKLKQEAWMIRRLVIWGTCLSLLTVIGVTSTQLKTDADPPASILHNDQIRVGISDRDMQDQAYPMARLSATGGFQLLDKNTGNVLFQSAGGNAVTVGVEAKGFWFTPDTPRERSAYYAGPLLFRAIPDASGGSGDVRILNITRRGNIPSYRGYFEVVRSGSDKISVINVLDLQDYLQAVVPNELPIRYGFEAVKAQAIAARNYALRPRERPWSAFDICDSQYCQAYYGKQTETPQTTQALRETHGLVALYKGDVLLALYSSSHGGYSENYENAFSDPGTTRFPGTPLPYLVGNPDNETAAKSYGDLHEEKNARAFWTTAVPSYDTASPYYRWKKQWNRAELEAVLNKSLSEISKDPFTAPFLTPAFRAGDRVGTLKRLSVRQRGVSGKAMLVEIETDRGHWLLKKEFVIRKALKHGGRMLPSANVVFDHLSNLSKGQPVLVSVVARGGGFGHGVGMSQLGASWMDGHGARFPAILQHYYRGAAIGTIPLVLSAGQRSPMQTTFFAREAQGTLWVRGTPGPVKLALNDKSLSLRIPDSGLARQNVDTWVMPGKTNILTLFPVEGDSPVRAWIEVVPAQAS